MSGHALDPDLADKIKATVYRHIREPASSEGLEISDWTFGEHGEVLREGTAKYWSRDLVGAELSVSNCHFYEDFSVKGTDP